MVDRPDPPEHLDAVHRRHPHVEEHRVRALPGERCQPRLPRVGNRRHVSLLPEGPREHVRDLDIVFDQEEVHSDFSSALSPELSHGTSSDRPRRPHVPRPPEIIVSLDRPPGHDNGRPLGDAVSTIHGERYLAEYATLLDGSQAMRSIRAIVENIADTDATVLIRGESGVSKDLVARAIHAASRRCSCPFIKVNCAAIPAGLLESELFGHEKGAFTGAHRRKPGQFEYAHKGTIYLDEIAELPSALQAKLLHVLQDLRFARVGGHGMIDVDTRIVAATNRDLEQALARGEFREDLYYRLNVVEIRIPPLRERKEEILVLAQRFLARFNEQYRRNKELFSRDDREAPAVCVARQRPRAGEHDPETRRAPRCRGGLRSPGDAPPADRLVPFLRDVAERRQLEGHRPPRGPGGGTQGAGGSPRARSVEPC